jgi:hypothetical protein
MYDKFHIVDAGHKPDFEPNHLMSHSIKGIVIETVIQVAYRYGNKMIMRQKFKHIPIRFLFVGQPLHTTTVGFFMKLESQGVESFTSLMNICDGYIGYSKSALTFPLVAVPVLSAFQVLHTG